MKNIYLSIIILLLLALPVFGQITNYGAIYDIYSNNILVELNIKLNQPQSFLEIDIPKDAEAVEAENFSFEIISSENKNKLIISNPNGLINIKYITSSFIDKSNNDNFFILNLNNENDITLKLPERAVLKYSLDSLEQSVFPRTNNVFTDGKRIIINWNENDLKGTDSILVIYNKETNSFWLIIFLIASGILSFILIKYFKKTSKKESDVTRNLFYEEKQIISILLNEKNKELWQKQIELKTGITKVRLSRKLRNLEEKGLIEKIPYGNTNKIRIK